MFSMIGAGDAFINVLLFGFSMYVLGRLFERQLGHFKLLTLYVVSGFAASVFALLFNGVVESATAAFFGLVGAALVLFRHDRRNLLWIYIVIAVTVIQTLLSAGRAIAWQGWVGGLVVGVAVAFAFEIEGSPQRVLRQRLIVAGIAAFLLLAAVVRTALS
jgi:membrane associated rhomboid family serine protease